MKMFNFCSIKSAHVSSFICWHSFTLPQTNDTMNDLYHLHKVRFLKELKTDPDSFGLFFMPVGLKRDEVWSKTGGKCQ